MRARLLAAGAVVLSFGRPAAAHRLDEYLQAATIAVEKGRVTVELRLAPGVAVLPAVLSGIDADASGAISPAEARSYGARVVHDLSLAVDGVPLPLRLVSAEADEVDAMGEGLGEIRLQLEADVPPGGHRRRLTFENHHQPRISAYLANALVPRDPDVRITAQERNYQQSTYRLDLLEDGEVSAPRPWGQWSAVVGWFGGTLAMLAGFRVRKARLEGTPSPAPISASRTPLR